MWETICDRVVSLSRTQLNPPLPKLEFHMEDCAGDWCVETITVSPPGTVSFTSVCRFYNPLIQRRVFVSRDGLLKLKDQNICKNYSLFIIHFGAIGYWLYVVWKVTLKFNRCLSSGCFGLNKNPKYWHWTFQIKGPSSLEFFVCKVKLFDKQSKVINEQCFFSRYVLPGV